MNVGELIQHLSDLDQEMPVTYISWDPSLKHFVKWDLAGVSERGEILTGDAVEHRAWPETFGV